MREQKDILAGHLVGRFAQRIEEALQHPRIALDRALRARAALLLGQEGDERAFPAARGIGEGNEFGGSGSHDGSSSANPVVTFALPGPRINTMREWCIYLTVRRGTAGALDKAVRTHDSYYLRLLRLRLVGVVGRVEAVPLAQRVEPGPQRRTLQPQVSYFTQGVLHLLG